jgi:hypothetical protein
VDFFIDHKLERKAKYELFNILAEYFNLKIKYFFDQNESNNNFARDLNFFIERHALDI